MKYSKIIITAGIVICIIAALSLIIPSSATGERTDKAQLNGSHVYDVALYKNEIIQGKENMKGFFNDYLQNKAATLYLFKVQEITEDNTLKGYATVFVMDSDGTGINFNTITRTDNHVPFKNEVKIEYYAPFTLGGNYSSFVSNLCFSILDGETDRLSFTQIDYSLDIEMDLDFLDDRFNYNVSDRLYYETDTCLEASDGEMPQILIDYISRYLRNQPAYLKVKNDSEYFLKYCNHGFSIDLSENGKRDETKSHHLEIDTIEDTVYFRISSYNHRISGYERVTLWEADIETALSSGVLFSTYYIYNEKGNPAFLPLDRIGRHRLVQQISQALKESPPKKITALLPEDYAYKMSFNSGIVIYLYETDGVLQKEAKILFPSSSEEKPTFAVELSDTVYTLIKDNIVAMPKEPPEDIKAQLTRIANEYHFESLPEFEEGEVPDYKEMQNYLSEISDKRYITGKEFNKFTYEHFYVTYNVKDKQRIPLKPRGKKEQSLVLKQNAVSMTDALTLAPAKYECIFESERGTIQVSFTLINNSTELGYIYYVIKN